MFPAALVCLVSKQATACCSSDMLKGRTFLFYQLYSENTLVMVSGYECKIFKTKQKKSHKILYQLQNLH